ncbi:MAG TPA: hypothetical protein VIJ57_08180, partial [Hanamia sp.]
MNQQIETNLIFEKNKSSAKKMPRKELIYRNDAIKSKAFLWISSRFIEFVLNKYLVFLNQISFTPLDSMVHNFVYLWRNGRNSKYI